MQKFGHLTLLVKEIQEAADFFIEKLDFIKTADVTGPNGFRWLTVSPKDQPDFGLVLIPADTEEKKNFIGNQAGGHVLLTFHTDNCQRDFELFQSRGVKFHGAPKANPWGTEVVFEDLYGNRFDLIQFNWNG